MRKAKPSMRICFQFAAQRQDSELRLAYPACASDVVTLLWSGVFVRDTTSECRCHGLSSLYIAPRPGPGANFFFLRTFIPGAFSHTNFYTSRMQGGHNQLDFDFLLLCLTIYKGKKLNKLRFEPSRQLQGCISNTLSLPIELTMSWWKIALYNTPVYSCISAHAQTWAPF